MDFICFKIPYEYRTCLDLKLKKITPRTRPQIRLYGVKNTACNAFSGSSGTLGDSVMRTQKDTFSGLSKGTKNLCERAVVSIDK